MATQVLDQARREKFAERMLGIWNDAFLALMISIGHQTRLFDAMAACPPATSKEIARAADLNGETEFALDLRTHLLALNVARNGHPNGSLRPMSPNQIVNVISTVSAMLNFGKDVKNNLLPSALSRPS